MAVQVDALRRAPLPPTDQVSLQPRDDSITDGQTNRARPRTNQLGDNADGMNSPTTKEEGQDEKQSEPMVVPLSSDPVADGWTWSEGTNVAPKVDQATSPVDSATTFMESATTSFGGASFFERISTVSLTQLGEGKQHVTLHVRTLTEAESHEMIVSDFAEILGKKEFAYKYAKNDAEDAAEDNARLDALLQLLLDGLISLHRCLRHCYRQPLLPALHP